MVENNSYLTKCLCQWYLSDYCVSFISQSIQYFETKVSEEKAKVIQKDWLSMLYCKSEISQQII